MMGENQGVLVGGCEDIDKQDSTEEERGGGDHDLGLVVLRHARSFLRVTRDFDKRETCRGPEWPSGEVQSGNTVLHQAKLHRDRGIKQHTHTNTHASHLARPRHA